MMEKDKGFYTAGIFARKAGVTLRTIHHYDKEGVLCPSSYNEAGYRLYSEKDFERLQKIMTLKFIGFSLDEIKEMMKSDHIQNNMKKSLDMQNDIIDEKIKHLTLVKKAINEAGSMIDSTSELDWNRFINIINVINMEQLWMNQYKNASNLSARICLHDQFSTNKLGWHKWFFQQIQLRDNLNILDLGCGNASLWLRNIDKIPSGCKITLTDISDGMLEDARKNLGPYSKEFSFDVVDAQNIPYENESFDIVIADHMLYHVADRKKAFSEIKRVLKADGYLYASTIGKKHLLELKNLLREFNTNVVISKSDFSEEFGLENGENQLSDYFHKTDILKYDDSLVVSQVEPLIDYIFSTTGNAKDFLTGEKLTSFNSFIENKIKVQGSIFITKDTGIFKSAK